MFTFTENSIYRNLYRNSPNDAEISIPTRFLIPASVRNFVLYQPRNLPTR